MVQIFLAMIILVVSATALARPWVGISSYYFLSILGPQYIWWWNFEGLRASLFVALCTLAGVAFSIVKHRCDFSFLYTRLNKVVLVLWLFLTASYFFGPFVADYSFSGRSPSQIFSLFNTIFVMYFCSVLSINNRDSLRFLSLAIVVATAYLTYWANSQYFSENWSNFNFGRLMGPRSPVGGSVYADENMFATFFVTGLPFVYYLGQGMKNAWIRYLLWAIIPMGCHAIFLTGSRGGLIGIGVALLFAVYLSNKRYLALPILLVAFLFYQWQAGSIMKERSEIITQYEEDRSAGDRLTAWSGGLSMVLSHPVTGVGLASFVTALPNYIDTRPMQAHNTFIQFTSESGIGAGIAYLAIILLFFANARRIRTWCLDHGDSPEGRSIERYNNASTVSFAGLLACSIFLSLNTYEIFFILLIFNNSLDLLCSGLSDLAQTHPLVA